MLPKILVATVPTGKAVFAHTAGANGSGEDRYAVQRRVEDACWLGYTCVLHRSDNEPATLKLPEESLKSTKVWVETGESVDKKEESEEMRHYHEQVGQEHQAKYDPNGNGEVENAIRSFSCLLRIKKLCLEKRRRAGWNIPAQVAKQRAHQERIWVSGCQVVARHRTGLQSVVARVMDLVRQRAVVGTEHTAVAVESALGCRTARTCSVAKA